MALRRKPESQFGSSAWFVPHVDDLRISPAGTWLATCGASGVSLFERATGALAWKSPGRLDSLKRVVFSRDEREVLVTAFEWAHLIDLEGARKPEQFGAVHGSCDAAFSPDGSRIAYFHGFDYVAVHDRAKGERRGIVEANGSPRGVEFTDDGDVVFATHTELVVMDDRLRRARWRRECAHPVHMHVRDGALWLVCADGSLQRIDLRTGEVEARWGADRSAPEGPERVRNLSAGVDIDEGGPRWALADEQGVHLFAADGVRTRKVAHVRPPRGERVTVAAGHGLTYCHWSDGPSLGAIRTFDAAGKQLPFDAPIQRIWVDARDGLMVNRAHQIEQLDSEDGSVITYLDGLMRAAGETGFLVDNEDQWSIVSGNDEIELPPDPDGYWDRAASPSGRTFVVFARGGALRVWNAGGELLAEDTVTHDRAAALTDERLWVQVAGGLGTWDLTSGEGGMRESASRLACRVAVASDVGQIAVYDRRREIVVLDGETLDELWATPYETPRGGGEDYAMSPDGSRLLSWGRDTLLYAAPGRLVAELDRSPLPWGTRVRSRFSPDGRFVAVAGRSRLRVYLAEDGTKIIDSKGPTHDLAFDVQRGVLWVARGGTIERWPLP